jgi:hypothetical protein
MDDIHVTSSSASWHTHGHATASMTRETMPDRQQWLESETTRRGLVLAATLLGGCLRFIRLGHEPLWVDEVILTQLVNAPGWSLQELPYVLLLRALPPAGLHSEFVLRLPAALFGTLTIPALYAVLPLKRFAVLAAWFVALCPLFVFWSRMARPYAMAGCFLVLGWRWWPCSVVAILTSPMAVLGINPDLWRRPSQRFAFVFLVVLGLVFFYVRPDRDRGFFQWRFLTHASRIWLIPSLVALLHLGSRRLSVAGRPDRRR